MVENRYSWHAENRPSGGKQHLHSCPRIEIDQPWGICRDVGEVGSVGVGKSGLRSRDIR
jgi:hypothetical protein